MLTIVAHMNWLINKVLLFGIASSESNGPRGI